jgi:hypothetical protein
VRPQPVRDRRRTYDRDARADARKRRQVDVIAVQMREKHAVNRQERAICNGACKTPEETHASSQSGIREQPDPARLYENGRVPEPGELQGFIV